MYMYYQSDYVLRIPCVKIKEFLPEQYCNMDHRPNYGRKKKGKVHVTKVSMYWYNNLHRVRQRVAASLVYIHYLQVYNVRSTTTLEIKVKVEHVGKRLREYEYMMWVIVVHALCCCCFFLPVMWDCHHQASSFNLTHRYGNYSICEFTGKLGHLTV